MTLPVNNGLYSRHLRDLEPLRKNWAWLMLLGVAFVVLGMLAIATSTITTLVSVVFLGTLLLISGVAQTVYAFWVRKWSGFFLSLLAGILYGVFGVFLIIHPLEGALSLTLLLGFVYMVGGLFRIIASIMSRFDQWGWALFSGIIKFALGLLILLGWPATGLWVLGLFIGIDFVFFGWFWVILALSLRKSDAKS